MEPQMLINQGLGESVAQRVSEIFDSGILSPEELDDRAFEALREFNQEGALEVLDQFINSDLSHVQNKSAFLCGVMKTYVTKSSSTADTTINQGAPSKADEGKIKALLERTGYTLDITSGQRKYGGPPPNWDGPVPGTGGSEKGCCQVFVGKIPRDCFEDEVIPLLEECGQIYDFRLMMDPESGLNRGYGFCTYTTKAGAQSAVKKLDNKEIRPGKKLGVCVSVANNRLFVGSIPKSKTKQEILEEFGRVTSDLTDVIVYLSPEQKGRNRGFAFLEYESHKAAALAKRRLQSGKVYVWGMAVAKVEWADPQEEPNEEVMAKVKVVYVRNLSPVITEENLQEEFGRFGTVERVKKLKDYAFVHFTERQDALNAIDALDQQVWDDIAISVSLAKPQPANKDNKRRGGPGMGQGPRGNQPRGGAPRGRGRGRGGYDQGYDNSGGYGGYGSYGGGGYDDGSGYDSYYDDSGYGGGGYSGGGYGNDGYGGGGGGGYSSRGGPRGGPRGSRSYGGPGGPSRGGPSRGGGGGFGRGGRGSRGGPPRGRGGRGGGGDGGFGPQKRKFGGDGYQGGGGGYSEPKRSYVDYNHQYGQQDSQQQWGGDYSYSDQGDQQWYQDSWSQQQGW